MTLLLQVLGSVIRDGILVLQQGMAGYGSDNGAKVLLLALSHWTRTMLTLWLLRGFRTLRYWSSENQQDFQKFLQLISLQLLGKSQSQCQCVDVHGTLEPWKRKPATLLFGMPAGITAIRVPECFLRATTWEW